MLPWSQVPRPAADPLVYARNPAQPSALGRADVVALADLDAVVAQDVVGGGDVEIEVRQRMPEQVLLAVELDLAAAHLHHHLALLGAVYLADPHGLHEI